MGISSFIRKLQLSGSELSSLGIAWIIFIIAFVPQALISGILSLVPGESVLSPTLTSQLSLIAFAIGGAFILHELGHKFAAQRFKAHAQFRLDREGMLITVVSIVLGFYFLVPGATFWQSELAQYDNIRGRVAVSGPIVNLFLGCFSLGCIGFGLNTNGMDLSTAINQGLLVVLEWIALNFGLISFFLNVYLGIFNLIPVWILDGKKILDWNELVWITMVIMFCLLIVAAKIAINLPFNFFIFHF